jgi:hypothetical protein
LLLQLAQKAGETAAQQLFLKVAGKGATKAALASSGQFGAKLGSKLAAKVGTKIGSKMGAKGFLGWIPVLGSLAGQGHRLGGE